jgi:hypothetical protein
MDCERFDQIIIDAVYDELDELTLAAAKRHADGCQHCQAAWSGLRATRKIGILPLVEAPVGLEPHIMQAAREAHRNLPWPKRVGRAISWAGSYAMRPQMAMAALLVLMLGSSIIFLRAKPDRSGALSRISVTERGVPEQSLEEPRSAAAASTDDRVPPGGRLGRRDEERANPPPPIAAAPFAAPPPESLGESHAQKGLEKPEPMADMAARPKSASGAGAIAPEDLALNAPPAQRSAAASEKKRGEAPMGFGGPAATASPSQDAFGAAMDLFNAGRYAEAEKAFDDIDASRSKDAPRAALMAAKSAENAFGYGKAAPKYEAVWSRYSATSPGAEALWLAADRYTKVANYGKAHDLLVQLRNVAGYRDRAEARLEDLKILEQQQQQVAAKARAAPARQPAKPAAAPAAPKATTDVMK